jgi:fibronectin type 3 domain-containing protein
MKISIIFPMLTLLLTISGCGDGGSGSSISGASVTLTWDAPTTNSDGSPLTDLNGYKIYYGTSSGNYTEVIDIGNVTSYTIGNLSSGIYYFAVTAYNTSGNESDFSNEVSKTL